MKKIVTALSIGLALSALPDNSFAQDLSLKGRSSLELNFGFWGGATASNSVTVTGIRSEATSSGFTGSLLYSYWMRERLSLTLSAGFLAGEASSSVGSSGINQQASAVVPVLVGLKLYLPDPEPEDMVRPFLSAAAGSYIGSEATNSALSQQAHSESALGGRVAAGADFFLSRHFKIGANLSYNLMTDFKTSIGARKNYSGGDFSVGLGYVF